MYKKVMLMCYMFVFAINCSVEQQNKHAIPHVLSNIAIGSLTGLSEVVSGRPLDYLKTLKISGKPMIAKGIVGKIVESYSGAQTHIASIIPATALQTVLEEYLRKYFSQEYTPALAGATSALFVCPIEKILLQQQQNPGSSFTVNFACLMKNNQKWKSFYKGVSMISLRELIFTSGYMKIMPELNNYCKENLNNPYAGKLLAACVGGSTLSLLSHPFESIRVWQQMDKSESVFDTIKKMSQAEGSLMKNLYKGSLYRSTRYVLALYMMSQTRKILIEKFKH